MTVPTLVLDSEGSSDDFTGMATAVAEALPRLPPELGRRVARGLDTVLGPVSTEFFKAD